MPEAPQPLAVFDFDDTLVHGDSMHRFFVLVAGLPAVLVALAQAYVMYIWLYFVRKDDRTPIERGTFFKQQMLDRLIAGQTRESIKEPVARLRAWLHWNDTMRRTLQEHYDKGHHVVIASGSLDIYLPDLLRDVPHHALLCTDLAMNGDVISGVMSHGNCVRQGKAERVKAYIAEHGPFGESWGYGNFPDDVPMMNLMKHRVIV